MREEIYKLLDCSNCNFATCETCEITWTDKKKIRDYIQELEDKIEELARVDLLQVYLYGYYKGKEERNEQN